MSVEAVQVIVSGRVQGVGYREFTRRAAERLGIAGHVRNRAEGTVEARLVGAPEPIEATLARIARGAAGGRGARGPHRFARANRARERVFRDGDAVAL